MGPGTAGHPDSEVVSGQATAIPAYPVPFRTAVRKQKAGAVSRPADGVVPSGLWCHLAPEPLNAFPDKEVKVTADDSLSRLDDDDYPAYTMGRAAEMLGTTQGFLRTPLRSAGGHRRYSRYQLRIAARARELVDQGTPIEAACRIIILEDQLEEAQRINAEYRRATDAASPAGTTS